MSFGDSNLLGGFTELEIAAGIPSLVDGTDRGYLEEYEEEIAVDWEKESLNLTDAESEIAFLSKYEKRRSGKPNDIVTEITECLTPEDAKYKTIQAIISNEVGYIIGRFGRRERIPHYCLDIVDDNDCLNKFIKGFLLKVLKLHPSSEIVQEIDLLVKNLKENAELETPYERVSRIQSYIHNKARFVSGINGHRKIPRNKIRLLLATARLHLSILDVSKNKKHSLYKICESNSKMEGSKIDTPSFYFGYLFKKSEMSAELELKYPKVIEPINGKYRPHWSVRHRKNIDYYCKIETRKKIEELKKIDNTNNLLSIKVLCLGIYF